MRKSTFIKKMVALSFVVLISINSMAAIISDSDGSAFINKADFEELKEKFASQIDRYNTSIDNKIDGAIANYLSGLPVTRDRSNILNVEWKEITFVNGVLNNTFKLPNVNFLFGLAAMHSPILDHPGATNNFYYVVAHTSRVFYEKNWSSVGNVYHNMVKSDKPYGDSSGKLIWNGQALRYNEKWMINRMVANWPVDVEQWAFLDRPDNYEFLIQITDFYSLVGVGDATNWDDVKSTIWPVGYKWMYRTRGSSGSYGTRDITFPANWIWDAASTNVSLDVDSSGNTTRYDHIVEYDKSFSWELFNPSWNHLINVSSNSTIKADDLKSAATTSSKARSFGLAMHVGDKDSHPRGMDDISVAQVTNTNSTLPSIGLISGNKASDTIYQDNEERDIEVIKGIKVTKTAPKLHEGFQLLAGKYDDVIEWEPEFSLAHVHNGASTYTDNTHEVDIYFSNGPFTDKTTTSNLIQVQVGNDTVKRDYATTTGRKCKVKFTMPTTGIVYVKCVPHSAGTYLNSDWLVTLNLSKCNKYILIRE